MGIDGEHRHVVRGPLSTAVRAPAGILTAVALLAATAVPAPAEACRLALLFALDVSASVDHEEYQLQLDGLTEALEDPAVRTAMLAPGGGVALAAYEWSGARQQALVAPWTLVTDGASLDAFIRDLARHTRQYGEFPTAVGYALGHGAVLMRSAPSCGRRVIDVSGDGVNNDGFGPSSAYREFDFDDITVNGLVIGGGNLELLSFYQLEVAHGPDAFVEVAGDYDDYARAMRRKLLRELGGDRVAGGDSPGQGVPQAWIPVAGRHP